MCLIIGLVPLFVPEGVVMISLRGRKFYRNPGMVSTLRERSSAVKDRSGRSSQSRKLGSSSRTAGIRRKDTNGRS